MLFNFLFSRLLLGLAPLFMDPHWCSFSSSLIHYLYVCSGVTLWVGWGFKFSKVGEVVWYIWSGILVWVFVGGAFVFNCPVLLLWLVFVIIFLGCDFLGLGCCAEYDWFLAQCWFLCILMNFYNRWSLWRGEWDDHFVVVLIFCLWCERITTGYWCLVWVVVPGYWMVLSRGFVWVQFLWVWFGLGYSLR